MSSPTTSVSTPAPPPMARGALLYVWLVIAGGIAVLAQGFWTWNVADWVRFLFLLTLSMFASGMKVTLSAGAGTMSLNFLFILIGIGSLSLGECLAMGTLGMVVQRFFQANRKPTALQIVFNVGAMAISVAASYAAYRATLSAQEWVQAPLRLLLAAGVFFLVNTMSVALVIGWTENRRSFAVWRDTYFWSFPNYLVGAFSAWCVNAVSGQFGWQASLLILPVLYLIYRSHRTYVERLEEEKLRAEQQRSHVEELAALQRRTIMTLALAIEAKDQTTHDHLARVEAYSLEIGKDLGLDQNQMQALAAGALLHDIGKLAVPEYIISKPGKLTPAEFEKMKIHPVVGAELLEQVGFPYPVAPIVRAHHERWDGSGYPDGLAGEDIPIGARILSAVDCLDALASDRQYRRALPLDEALKVVLSESGKSFDPQVVDVLRRRYVELEKKARESAAQLASTKLSTDLKVERGSAPAAGFEESAKAAHATREIVNLHGSVAGSDLMVALRVLDGQLQKCESPVQVFQELCSGLQDLVPYDLLVIYRRTGNHLKAAFLDGIGQEQFAHLEIPMGMGLAGWVAENHKAILNGNPTVEPGYLEDPTNYSTFGSALAVPVESPDLEAGVISLYRAERNAFHSRELDILQQIASNAKQVLAQVPHR